MIGPMAYDEDLAGRIRELIASEDGYTEQKMFGGREPFVSSAGIREREHAVDDGPDTARGDQVVDALEVGGRPHRRAEDRELLPPDPVERRGRVRAGRCAADDHASFRPRGVER